jgi:hypothetical protein
MRGRTLLAILAAATIGYLVGKDNPRSIVSIKYEDPQMQKGENLDGDIQEQGN